MKEATLQVSNLSVMQGGRQVLQEISFALPQGTFCGLIGTNGAGKTTLLRAILGLLPRQGDLRVNGQVGYVPQKLHFEPDLPIRVRDFVGLGLDGHRFGLVFPSRARTAKIEAALNGVEALALADQRIGQLSGGQQQRVMIAHALVRSPSLLLLDEPLANLDIKAASEIVTLLKKLCTDLKMTILLSAHDMTPLIPVMDKIVYVAGGKAVCGPVQEVIRTEILSALYGYHIDVIRVHGRLLVIAGGTDHHHEHEHVVAVP